MSDARQGTHWEDCWLSHIDCARAHIETLERQLGEALKDVDDISRGAWGSSAAMIVAQKHHVETLERQLGEARKALRRAQHWHEQQDFDEALNTIDAALGEDT